MSSIEKWVEIEMFKRWITLKNIIKITPMHLQIPIWSWEIPGISPPISPPQTLINRELWNSEQNLNMAFLKVKLPNKFGNLSWSKYFNNGSNFQQSLRDTNVTLESSSWRNSREVPHQKCPERYDKNYNMHFLPRLCSVSYLCRLRKNIPESFVQTFYPPLVSTKVSFITIQVPGYNTPIKT